MSLPLYAIYGAGGFGREVLAVARGILSTANTAMSRLVVVDDNYPGESVNGAPVVPYAEFREIPAAARHVAIAIADGRIRERLASMCATDQVLPWSIVAPNVVILDEVKIGVGSIVMPFVSITSNIVIGDYFHANSFCNVAHDCVVGDFVTLAPGAKCNGNVEIRDFGYVGAGAVIKQGRSGSPVVIGEGAIVGMGAVVTRSVPAGETVVGSPARPLQRNRG